MWGFPVRVLLIVGYLFLLAASVVYEKVSVYRPEAREGQFSRKISIYDDEGVQHSTEIRYLDTNPQASGEAPVVLALHGSPVATSAIEGLVNELASSRRVIAPDLPGFGRSPSWSGGYSIESHARAIASFLSSLGIEKCHVLGYSMGGGVALELTQMKPSTVESLVLASSIGLQEYELLGDYSLNHAIHGSQLFAIWAASWLLPDFGFLERQPLNINYAKNFYETDQRRLREPIESWEKPVLVLHGDADFLVPVEAAKEHARLMPQSEIVEYPGGGHMLAIYSPEVMATDIGLFLSSVEVGRARNRDGLPVVGHAVSSQRSQWGLGGLLAFATFASEDLACIGGGLIASRGTISLGTAIIACFVGIFVGDFAIYLIGRIFGKSAFSLPVLRRIANPERVNRFAKWFDQKWLVVSTRFIPGSRVATYFAAGMVKAGVARFVLALLVACGVWTPILVGISYVLGGRFLEVLDEYGGIAFLGLLLVVVLLLLVVRVGVSLVTWKGRRLLYSKFKRVTRWEFWPWWALYPLVYTYLIWLMIKHRSVTAFSAVNPFMPAGGLVYESKSDILTHLRSHGCPVADFDVIDRRLSVGDRVQAVVRFMEKEGLGFPIVLKPDVGQRGQGVVIAKSIDAVRVFFESENEDVIAQRFVGGSEYGLFYYRYPDQENGCLLSITDKRFTSVVGDGESSLEKLILEDSRAVCLAEYFLEEYSEELDTVLERGKEKQLAELGTHCRGALFLDGEDLITDALNGCVDSFSRGVKGFNFGRFDVRAPSADALAAGQGIQIIELNGLTSESTNMYDPKHGLLFAYKTLFNQWKIAFEIGVENRKRGESGAKLRELLRLIFDYLAGESSEAAAETIDRLKRDQRTETV